jgi:hypothetical protein
VDDRPGPVYRSAGGSRKAAWVVFIVALAVGLGINSGGGSLVTGAIGAVCLIIAFLALSSLRFQVRAEPTQLVVCSGGPTRKIPWKDVDGFGVDEQRGRNVYVVVADRKLLLPIPDVRTGKVTPNEVCDQLQRYWKTHRR